MIMMDYQHEVISIDASMEIRAGAGMPKVKLWVIRGQTWVPTVTSGPGQLENLQLFNVDDRALAIQRGKVLGM